MTNFTRFDRISQDYVKNRIKDIPLYLKDWSICDKHRQRIFALEKRLLTTPCPRIVLNTLRNNTWRYGLTKHDADTLNKKIGSILTTLRRIKEVPQIFELLKKYSPRFSSTCGVIYLTVPEVILNNINFGRFRAGYNWQTDTFLFEPISKPVFSYENGYSFHKTKAYFHPLTCVLKTRSQSLNSYLKDNTLDFSPSEALVCLVETLSGKKVDFSNIVEIFWGPRKCRYCWEKIVEESDVSSCAECDNNICSVCEVLETWRSNDGATDVYTLCQTCVARIMRK